MFLALFLNFFSCRYFEDPHNPLNLYVKSLSVYQIRSRCGLLKGKFHTAIIVVTENPETEIGIRMSDECGANLPTRTFNAE